jgi:hypothetical protein
MPERTNGTVLKTVEAQVSVGSNPTPSADAIHRVRVGRGRRPDAGQPARAPRDCRDPIRRTDAMSDLFDKAKDLLAENSDTVDGVVDKLAGLVDDKTGGKHKDQVRQGAAKAKDAIAQLVDDDEPKKQQKPRPAANAE